MTLYGCAGTVASYTPPSTSGENVNTEKVVDAIFDVTWDEYVKELSKSFFVINNISKESKIINVSFSTNRPSNYIKCGTTQVTSKHPARGTQTFTFAASDSSDHWVGVDGTNHILNNSRRAELEGRANIYIAPAPNDQTIMRANARYVLGIEEKISGVTILHQQTNNYSLSFSTQEIGTTSDGMTCISNGKFEQELLGLAKF
jgi:hypothetical protein